MGLRDRTEFHRGRRATSRDDLLPQLGKAIFEELGGETAV
jgi:hypothetical protein